VEEFPRPSKEKLLQSQKTRSGSQDSDGKDGGKDEEPKFRDFEVNTVFRED